MTRNNLIKYTLYLINTEIESMEADVEYTNDSFEGLLVMTAEHIGIMPTEEVEDILPKCTNTERLKIWQGLFNNAVIG